MATGLKLPPLPWGQLDFKDPQWQDWFKALRNYVVTTGVAWAGINFLGSKLSDIQTRPHSALQSILGGGDYHLSLAQYNLLSPSNTGTWVPTLSGFTFTGTPVTTANYTRIADTVHYWIKISATTIATTSATVTLPITGASESTAQVVSSAGTGSVVYVSTSAVSVPNGSGVSYLLLSGTYRV